MLLLVNRDRFFLETAGRALSEAGVRVAPASDGASAVTALRMLPEIKLVLLAGDLPDISGACLVEELRNVRTALNIIAMAKAPSEWILAVAQSVGADMRVRKPVAASHSITSQTLSAISE